MRQDHDRHRQLEFERWRQFFDGVAIGVQHDGVISLGQRLEYPHEAVNLLTLRVHRRIAGGDDLQRELDVDTDHVVEAGTASCQIGEARRARKTGPGQSTAEAPRVKSISKTCSRLATSARAILIASCVASICGVAPDTSTARGAPSFGRRRRCD